MRCTNINNIKNVITYNKIDKLKLHIYPKNIVPKNKVFSKSFILRSINYINNSLLFTPIKKGVVVHEKHVSLEESKALWFIIETVASFAYPSHKNVVSDSLDIESINDILIDLYGNYGVLFANNKPVHTVIKDYIYSENLITTLFGYTDFYGRFCYDNNQLFFIIQQRCCFILDACITSYKISSNEYYSIENARNIIEQFINKSFKLDSFIKPNLRKDICSKLDFLIYLNINLIIFFRRKISRITINTNGINSLDFNNKTISDTDIIGYYYEKIDATNAYLFNIKTSSVFAFFLSLNGILKNSSNNILYPKIIARSMYIELPNEIYHKLGEYLLHEINSKKIYDNKHSENNSFYSLVNICKNDDQKEIKVILNDGMECRFNLICPIYMTIPSLEDGDFCAIKYKNIIQIYSLKALKKLFIIEETEKLPNMTNSLQKNIFLVPHIQISFSHPDVMLLGKWWLMTNISNFIVQ